MIASCRLFGSLFMVFSMNPLYAKTSQESSILLPKFGQLVRCVALEPATFDHVSLKRGRGLLILAGENVFALNFADSIEYIERFPFRVKRLSSRAEERACFPE